MIFIHRCPRIDHISIYCHSVDVLTEKSFTLILFVFVSFQDSSTSDQMIVDKDISITNSLSNTDSNQPVNTTINLDNDNSANSSPAYRSHIQKRQINLGRYYDGMMRATSSHLPTHDLRCNLTSNKPVSSEGVNEETVRQGRILLDSIPNTIDVENQFKEDISTG